MTSCQDCEIINKVEGIQIVLLDSTLKNYILCKNRKLGGLLD